MKLKDYLKQQSEYDLRDKRYLVYNKDVTVDVHEVDDDIEIIDSLMKTEGTIYLKTEDVISNNRFQIAFYRLLNSLAKYRFQSSVIEDCFTNEISFEEFIRKFLTDEIYYELEIDDKHVADSFVENAGNVEYIEKLITTVLEQ